MFVRVSSNKILETWSFLSMCLVKVNGVSTFFLFNFAWDIAILCDCFWLLSLSIESDEDARNTSTLDFLVEKQGIKMHSCEYPKFNLVKFWNVQNCLHVVPNDMGALIRNCQVYCNYFSMWCVATGTLNACSLKHSSSFWDYIMQSILSTLYKNLSRKSACRTPENCPYLLTGCSAVVSPRFLEQEISTLGKHNDMVAKVFEELETQQVVKSDELVEMNTWIKAMRSLCRVHKISQGGSLFLSRWLTEQVDIWLQLWDWNLSNLYNWRLIQFILSHTDAEAKAEPLNYTILYLCLC